MLNFIQYIHIHQSPPSHPRLFEKVIAPLVAGTPVPFKKGGLSSIINVLRQTNDIFHKPGMPLSHPS